VIKKHYRAAALYSGVVDSTVAPLLALEDLDLRREDMLLLYVDLRGFADRKKRAEQRANILGMDFIAIEGRKGGSALAACAINALADIAIAQKKEGA